MALRIYQCVGCGYRPTSMDSDERCPCSVNVDGVEVECGGDLVQQPLWCCGCGVVDEIEIVDDYTGPLCRGCVVDRSLPVTQRIPVLSMWDVVEGGR